MTAIPFGPQLIGQTEKTLNALLRRALEGTGLDEPGWVTLRVADQLDGDVDAPGLAAAVFDATRVEHAPGVVTDLHDRGLLDGGRISDDGRSLLTEVLDRIADLAGPIWRDLPTDDVEAATRVLNEVLHRARGRLAG